MPNVSLQEAADVVINRRLAGNYSSPSIKQITGVADLHRIERCIDLLIAVREFPSVHMNPQLRTQLGGIVHGRYRSPERNASWEIRYVQFQGAAVSEIPICRLAGRQANTIPAGRARAVHRAPKARPSVTLLPNLPNHANGLPILHVMALPERKGNIKPRVPAKNPWPGKCPPIYQPPIVAGPGLQSAMASEAGLWRYNP